ncbi:MAG: methionyl-tRNA formyltransferase [Methylococcaceae bacterium]|nr:methionyl-tRNA formyltransferase [Methylococcaceae bacterium]
MKIIFAGTPEFAVPSLQALLDSPYPVVAVYTQPDRPAGRGRKLPPSPVKQLAQRHGIPILQPESLKPEAEQEALRLWDADLMVVAAYGLILPKTVLAIPRLGCINVHASLLPRWRGAAPLQRAIAAGDGETGVTIMVVEPKLDSGPMLSKISLAILPGETAGELHDRLAHAGAKALAEILPAVADRTAPAEPQDEALVTYAEKLDKAEAELDWGQPAAVLERRVRAYNPWPVAQTSLDGEAMRIWRAEVVAGSASQPPGGIEPGNGKTLDVATGDGMLRILELQMPGGKRIAAADFLNSRNLGGRRLGRP